MGAISSATLQQAVEAALRYLGVKGVKRVTTETVQAVRADGTLQTSDGHALRTSGPYVGMRAGQDVPVLWSRQEGNKRGGVVPAAVLASQQRPGAGTGARQPVSRNPQMEELILAAISETDSRLDVWFRDPFQFVRLNLRDDLPFNPSAVVWGDLDNTFALLCKGPGSSSAFDDHLRQDTYHVFRLSRSAGVPYGPGTTASASLVRRDPNARVEGIGSYARAAHQNWRMPVVLYEGGPPLASPAAFTLVGTLGWSASSSTAFTAWAQGGDPVALTRALDVITLTTIVASGTVSNSGAINTPYAILTGWKVDETTIWYHVPNQPGYAGPVTDFIDMDVIGPITNTRGLMPDVTVEDVLEVPGTEYSPVSPVGLRFVFVLCHLPQGASGGTSIDSGGGGHAVLNITQRRVEFADVVGTAYIDGTGDDVLLDVPETAGGNTVTYPVFYSLGGTSTWSRPIPVADWDANPTVRDEYIALLHSLIEYPSTVGSQVRVTAAQGGYLTRNDPLGLIDIKQELVVLSWSPAKSACRIWVKTYLDGVVGSAPFTALVLDGVGHIIQVIQADNASREPRILTGGSVHVLFEQWDAIGLADNEILLSNYVATPRRALALPRAGGGNPFTDPAYVALVNKDKPIIVLGDVFYLRGERSRKAIAAWSGPGGTPTLDLVYVAATDLFRYVPDARFGASGDRLKDPPSPLATWVEYYVAAYHAVGL